jgi:hypothetical protein
MATKETSSAPFSPDHARQFLSITPGRYEKGPNIFIYIYITRSQQFSKRFRAPLEVVQMGVCGDSEIGSGS